VGKTTLAASLALRAAVQGKKVLVCTIDPARRLASAMGLEHLDQTERPISRELLEKVTGRRVPGQLSAMMLDLKRSWDEVVERYAAPDRRQAILGNRFYQQMSTALAGSQEYVAMEKLHALHGQHAYDLVILDTPPTSHALDFLDAPTRVLDFLDNEAARWLMTPAAGAGRLGMRVVGTGSAMATRLLARFTGAGTLEELARFLGSMQGMYEGFKQRAAEVKQLLASRACCFAVVTSPAPQPITQALHFHTMLAQNGMQVAAVLMNRMNIDFAQGASLKDAQVLEATAGMRAPPIPGLAPLGPRLIANLQDEQVLWELDRDQLQVLQKKCQPTPVIGVPRLDSGVHDLVKLWELTGHLFPDSAASR
jgi:anion-transporting  ArsA/GET3 family ATPase